MGHDDGMLRRRTRRLAHLDSAHLLAIVAIVVALAAPAGAALVTATGIANNAVQSRHIKNASITSADLAAKSVTNKQLAVGAIKAPNLANGSIGTNQVADGSLTGADLVDGSVTAFDLAPGTVGASALAGGSITTSLLADGGVSTADLADGAVTTGKIGDGAVTGSKLGNLSVTSGKLADGAVTSAKFATGAVDEAAIGAGAVDSIELASGAVQATHLEANAVTGAKLGQVVGTTVTAANVTIPADPDIAPALNETNGTNVTFAAEVFDTASMWAASLPTDVIPPTDGVYAITAWIDWAADNDGWREVQITVDGTIIAQQRIAAFNGTLGNRTNMTISGVTNLLQGEEIRLRVSHAAGSDLVASRVRLSAYRIGTT